MASWLPSMQPIARSEEVTQTCVVADAGFWPSASEIDARSFVGDEGDSGRVVLNVSFVESDPHRT